MERKPRSPINVLQQSFACVLSHHPGAQCLASSMYDEIKLSTLHASLHYLHLGQPIVEVGSMHDLHTLWALSRIIGAYSGEVAHRLSRLSYTQPR